MKTAACYDGTGPTSSLA